MLDDVNGLMRAANTKYVEKIIRSRDFLQEELKGIEPKLAIVLGTGLKKLAHDPDLDKLMEIPYKDIPHFPRSAVSGHENRLVVANYHCIPVFILSGRTHFYEAVGVPGWNSTQAMRHITLPIRVMKALGIEALFLSNAAGGVNPDVDPPELMLCTSYTNATGASPNSGLNMDLLGIRFTPMAGDECNPKLAKYVRKSAKTSKVQLREGVYQMNPGPEYELTGEGLLLQAQETDAVGMSTVPEVKAALHGYYSEKDYNKAMNKLKIKNPEGFDYTMARRLPVVGVSCLTNVFGPDGKNSTNHEEVERNGEKNGESFAALAKGFIDLFYENR